MENVARLKKCWMQKCMSMIKFIERMTIEDLDMEIVEIEAKRAE